MRPPKAPSVARHTSKVGARARNLERRFLPSSGGGGIQFDAGGVYGPNNYGAGLVIETNDVVSESFHNDNWTDPSGEWGIAISTKHGMLITKQKDASAFTYALEVLSEGLDEDVASGYANGIQVIAESVGGGHSVGQDFYTYAEAGFTINAQGFADANNFVGTADAMGLNFEASSWDGEAVGATLIARSNNEGNNATGLFATARNKNGQESTGVWGVGYTDGTAFAKGGEFKAEQWPGLGTGDVVAGVFRVTTDGANVNGTLIQGHTNGVKTLEIDLAGNIHIPSGATVISDL